MIEDSSYCSDSYAMNRIKPYHLDGFNEKMSMSVYCSCGRVVILGRSEMKTRLDLKKELECMTCRNARISKEIDAMNDHFNGVDETDESIVDL